MLRIIGVLTNIIKISNKRARDRHYFCNMESPVLHPPATIRGMTKLDKSAFQKIVKVPKLVVPELKLNIVLPHIKKMLLKMEHLKPVEDDPLTATKKILLHPLAVNVWQDLPTVKLEEVGLTDSSLIWDNVELNYGNWRSDEILKAILPLDMEGLSSFSRMGHLIHVNLKDHLLEYKTLIGEVLKDKIPGIRTVVNKLQTIDNTYRNFQMELLCGETDYHVQVKENGITFEFDFSTVYWNSRLSSEHERIVKLLKPGDVLYDIFGGVGPFSVPAAKKKCHVLGNDLNPDSFKYLNENVKKNKVGSWIKTFNLDGREFIQTEIKTDLKKRWTDGFTNKIHITMNLPAMAVEFLNAFEGLFAGDESLKGVVFPLVHVYCFAKGVADPKDIARDLVESHMNFKLGENLEGIHFVRHVAPNKNMMRVSFFLTEEILFYDKSKCHKRKDRSPEPPITDSKKQCID